MKEMNVALIFLAVLGISSAYANCPAPQAIQLFITPTPGEIALAANDSDGIRWTGVVNSKTRSLDLVGNLDSVYAQPVDGPGNRAIVKGVECVYENKKEAGYIRLISNTSIIHEVSSIGVDPVSMSVDLSKYWSRYTYEGSDGKSVTKYKCYRGAGYALGTDDCPFRLFQDGGGVKKPSVVVRKEEHAVDSAGGKIDS